MFNCRRIRAKGSSSTLRQVLMDALEPRQFLSLTATIALPASIDEGSPVEAQLEASAEYEEVVGWNISWGDGTEDYLEGNPSTATHTYADNGEYSVFATVFGSGYLSTCDASATATVNDVAPNLGVDAPPDAYLDEPYYLSAYASDPGQDTVVSWTVNWGDSSPLEQFNGSEITSATHIYTSEGTKAIYVQATNEDGTFGPPQYDVVVVQRSIYSFTVTNANDSSEYATTSAPSSEPLLLLTPDELFQTTVTLSAVVYPIGPALFALFADGVKIFDDIGDSTILDWSLADEYRAVAYIDRNHDGVAQDGELQYGNDIVMQSKRVVSLSATNSTGGDTAEVVNGEAVVLVTGRNANNEKVDTPMLGLVTPPGGMTAGEQSMLAGGTRKLRINVPAATPPGTYTVTINLAGNPPGTPPTCTITIHK